MATNVRFVLKILKKSGYATKTLIVLYSRTFIGAANKKERDKSKCCRYFENIAAVQEDAGQTT